MAENLNINGTNSIAEGAGIYKKGEPVHSVALILKGRVTVQAEGVKQVVGSGNFLGICDVEAGKHSFTYTALDDTIVYGLPAGSLDQIRLMLEEKPQYRGLLVTSLNFFISDLYKNFIKLKDEERKIIDFILETYREYSSLAEAAGQKPEKITALEQLTERDRDEFSLPEELEYYIQCGKIPVEAQKNFYGGNAFVAWETYSGQCRVIPGLAEGCRHYGERLYRYFRYMIMNEKNLFGLLGKLALSVKKSGQDVSGLSAMIDRMLEKINELETLLIETAGLTPNLNRGRMEELYFALLSDSTEGLLSDGNGDVELLNDSLSQILDYAPVHGKVAEEFREKVEEFIQMSDKFSRTPEATATRKTMAAAFFEIYEGVVKKSFDDANPPLAVRLFLRYGYVSEELLTVDELRELLALHAPDGEDLRCRVYTMEMWLREIYEGRKMPSKDEFDTDYEQMLRQEQAEGLRDKKSVREALEDPDARLHYEIDKLMRYADRVLSGNISAFVPILCSEGIVGRLDSSIVIGSAVNAAVRKVEKVDYSIFYREKLTSYEEIEVNHFVNIEYYAPDFILFPVYGRNSLMWQDVEGRRKDTHGRILLPILLEPDLEQEILKLMAYFRWEKCRTDMGMQWNNYRYPSLTSEYTDYLQFYRKNNELSPERKEKVKAQLQQCNNRHRDVFARDYQDWIMRESTGAMKLNRVAREILFTYCPFSSEIAEGLLSQNAYKDAAKRYNIEKRKQEKALDSIIRRFEKAGRTLPDEVNRTKTYLLDT